MNDGCPIKCMITIVNRGKGDDIVEYLKKNNVLTSFIMPGHGTAAANWQNLLGLGDTKKDIVITLLDKTHVNEIMEGLGDSFGIRGAGHGVAFTIDVGSIGGRRLLNYCLGKVEE